MIEFYTSTDTRLQVSKFQSKYEDEEFVVPGMVAAPHYANLDF